MPMMLADPSGLAVVDPAKKYGEHGQYQMYQGSSEELEVIAKSAREEAKELRWYYKALVANGSEPIGSQVIITEIPPGHVQPFHMHKTLHEMSLVEEGTLLAIDHETLTEEELRQMIWKDPFFREAVIVKVGQMVIEGPGTRHTITNHTLSYARFCTVQTARMGVNEFPADWHRDGK